MDTHALTAFLETFVPEVEAKSRQYNQASWLLNTTGTKDASDLKASLEGELCGLYNDPIILDKLTQGSHSASISDPLLHRQLHLLIRNFKQNTVPQPLLEAIANTQASVGRTYINFRATMNGDMYTENDLRNILKKEEDFGRRRQAWEASKQVGELLAADILTLVRLRNKAAKLAGYPDYFKMQLDLHEVKEERLFGLLDDLDAKSEEAFLHALAQIEKRQMQRFGVSEHELGPWAWSEPFSQEDPLQNSELDDLISGQDLLAINAQFYQKMGIDISSIQKNSDLFERSGKNQHAFCVNIDRAQDIRTLNNVKQTITWLEVLLHEFGHAVYEMGLDPSLPWLLREPPHMITTEAMALVAGRQAYRAPLLSILLDNTQHHLIPASEASLQRRQLIFSRWVMVMTYFERELYANPDQDLNKLWWTLVGRFQRIRVPKQREGKSDWAAKIHIGVAPVYYYSYLLGEMFASQIEEFLEKNIGSQELCTEQAGRYLQERLFKPANSLNWADLVKHVVDQPLSPDAWLRQFAVRNSKGSQYV